MSDADHVLVVHVQRTAGTSLRLALEAAHGAACVHPSAAELGSRPGGRYETAADLLARWDTLPQHRFLFGHYVAALVDVLPIPYRTATFLREPVARSVSIIEHHAAQSQRAVSDLLDDEAFLAGHVTDLQTRVFGSEIPVDDGLPQVMRPQEAPRADDNTLERAIDRLASFDFVGLTEDLSRSVSRFDAMFGTHVSPTIGQVNQSQASDVPRVEIERLVAPLVTRDVELLAQARARVAQAGS